MKYNKALFTGLIGLILLAITSCERKKPEEPKSIGGKGGNVTIKATAQHHDRNIDSCTIYIKYNSTTSATSYDDSAVCVQVDSKPVATFKGLKKGDYYLSGKGWDGKIGEPVKGGASFTAAEEKEYDVFVPVTEDH